MTYIEKNPTARLVFAFPTCRCRRCDDGCTSCNPLFHTNPATSTTTEIPDFPTPLLTCLFYSFERMIDETIDRVVFSKAIDKVKDVLQLDCL